MISKGLTRLFLIAQVCCLLGCVTTSPRVLSPSYSTEVSKLLEGKAILGHSVTEAELPQFDVFRITPEMLAFAQAAVRRGDTYFDRVKSLHVALLSSSSAGGRGIVYNSYFTETPEVTFAQRKANCLSFTLLYVALARAVGINALVNEVQIPPTWDLRNKKDMVFFRHVNVKVPVSRENPNVLNNDDVIIDLEMSRFRSNYSQYPINDVSATAQFYSNRAMEFLERDQYTDAFLSLRKSIDLNSRQAYVWGNLGVLYSRLKLWKEAEVAYLQGLSVEPTHLTLMNNLSYLYRQTGNKELADKYSRLAQKYRESNPFFQFSLAQSAFEEGNYLAAEALISRAIKLQDNDARFYELAAAIDEKLNRPNHQADMLKKAKKYKRLDVYLSEHVL